MDAGRVLVMLLSLHAPVSRTRLETLAEAIASAASTPHEAAVLIAIEYEETSLRSLPLHEFGVTNRSGHLDGEPLARWAAASLSMWRAGYRRHNDDLSGFFFYNSGRWMQNTHGHTRRFRRVGRRALAYARRCMNVVARLTP